MTRVQESRRGLIFSPFGAGVPRHLPTASVEGEGSSSRGNGLSRRSFLQKTGGTAAALTLGPLVGPLAATAAAFNNPLFKIAIGAASGGLSSTAAHIDSGTRFVLDACGGSPKNIALSASPLLTIFNQLSPECGTLLEGENIQAVCYFFNPFQEAEDSFLGNCIPNTNTYDNRMRAACNTRIRNRDLFIKDTGVRDFISNDWLGGGYSPAKEEMDDLAGQLFNDLQHKVSGLYKSLLEALRAARKVQTTVPGSEVANVLHREITSKYPQLGRLIHLEEAAQRKHLEKEGKVDKEASKAKQANEDSEKPCPGYITIYEDSSGVQVLDSSEIYVKRYRPTGFIFPTDFNLDDLPLDFSPLFSNS